MGTRNLTIVKHNEEIKVAQYCQWDGYPKGAGLEILDFLQNQMDLTKFKEKISKCAWATVEELSNADEAADAIRAKLKELKISHPERYDIENPMSKRNDILLNAYPEYHRDTGCKILLIIQESKKHLLLQNNLAFGGDKLFCEWAWIIDLDTMRLEVYSSGFEDFHDAPKGVFETLPDPVRLCKSFDLNILPDPIKFVAAIEALWPPDVFEDA